MKDKTLDSGRCDEKKGGHIYAFYERIASYLLKIIYFKSLEKLVMKRIRKFEVMSKAELKDKAEAFMLKLYTEILMMLTAVLILCAVVVIMGKKNVNDVLKRPDVGRNEKSYEIELSKDDETWVRNFSLSPRSYTEKEFEILADEAENYVQDIFLSDNSDAESIKRDMLLPETDETGNLSIEWKSSDPTVVNRFGFVNNDEIEEATKITLTGSIIYEEYEREMVLNVVVLPSGQDKDDVTIAIENLEDMQEEEREEETFDLPSDEGGFSVALKKDYKDKAGSIALIGILLVGVYAYSKINELDESGKKRDRELLDDYYSFVSKMILGLNSGMSLRGAFTRMVEDEKRSGRNKRRVLYQEIAVMLSEISNGVSEEEAYAGLGKRIGIPEYIRIMSLIEQNLTHGNKDLVKLLLEEERKAGFQLKERMKKRGEEASEKLLLPMLILLLVVIGIVVYPAFVNL